MKRTLAQNAALTRYRERKRLKAHQRRRTPMAIAHDAVGEAVWSGDLLRAARLFDAMPERYRFVAYLSLFLQRLNSKRSSRGAAAQPEEAGS